MALTKVNKKPSKQMEFVKRMIDAYRVERGTDPVHMRRLHYFIVTRPEAVRQIPSKSGTRRYENTLNEWKNLCTVRADASVRGLIPADWVWDKKSGNIEAGYSIQDYSLSFDASGHYVDEIDIRLNSVDNVNFDDYVDNLSSSNSRSYGKHQFQDYHIIICVEKLAFEKEIIALCKTHGADFLAFEGQPTVTRAFDIAKIANRKNKPVLVLYFVDLDPAGLIMVNAIRRRLNQIYKAGKPNKVIRMGLTRAQVESNNLPVNFEVKTKGYKPKIVNEFIEITGSDACVELDALPKEEFLEIIEDSLKAYSKFDVNHDYNKKLDDERRVMVDEADSDISAVDFTDMEDEYDELVEKRDELYEKVRNFIANMQDDIDEVNGEINVFERTVKSRLDVVIEDVKNNHPTLVSKM